MAGEVALLAECIPSMVIIAIIARTSAIDQLPSVLVVASRALILSPGHASFASVIADHRNACGISVGFVATDTITGRINCIELAIISRLTGGTSLVV